MTCTVWDFDIPDEVHFKNAYALYGLNDYEGQRVQYYNFLKEYRLTSCYLPINEENYRVYKSTDDYLSVLLNVDNNLTTSAFFNLGYRRVNKMVWTCFGLRPRGSHGQPFGRFRLSRLRCGRGKIPKLDMPQLQNILYGQNASRRLCLQDLRCGKTEENTANAGALFKKRGAVKRCLPKCGHEDLNNTFKQYKQHYFNERFQRKHLQSLQKRTLTARCMR